MRKLFLLLCILILCNHAYAEDDKKVMTRAQVIDKLSASDFLKKKIGDLFSWNVGYDITKINRTNLAPTISLINLTPGKVPPDNRTIVFITAKVSDPSGADNIRGVRADLSSIKKLPNMMLVDNGLWGDKMSGDGVYTVQTNVGYDVQSGVKEIPVAVSNKLGWVALAKTSMDVQLNPILSDGKASPQKVKADGTSKVLLAIKVENPGRQEDLRNVTIDLSPIGMEKYIKMLDNGTSGDEKAQDKTYSLSVTVKEGTGSGIKKLQVTADNVYEGKGYGEILLEVE